MRKATGTICSSLNMAVTVTKDNVFDAIFQTWLRCSDMMKLLATANGVTFLEIVHQNRTTRRRSGPRPNVRAELLEASYL